MNSVPRLITLVLKATALGMAVATVVLDTLKTLAPETGLSLLALGLACLALAALQKDA